MTTQIDAQKVYTLEDFRKLPDDGKRYELIDGKIIEMSPAREDHGRIGSRLNGLLGYHILTNRLGDTYGPDANFQIGEDSLCPDVAFVAKGRLKEADRGVVVIPVPPDLAVEVVSPSESKRSIKEKVDKYLEAGVKLVWVIYPRKKTIEIYHPDNAPPKTLNANDELDGELVVPGFKLKVSILFEYE